MDKNFIYHGDCLELMKQINDNSIDAIITDPPYSLGYDFDNDNLSYSDQSNFMKQYMREFYRVLKPNGTACIFMSQELTHYLYFAAIENKFTWQNEIVWNRDGGQMPTKKFGICHEIINVYTKGKEHKTFNLDELRVQSKYAKSDKRLNPKGKNPGDVWYVPALFGKKLERLIGNNGKALHPTQKPLDIILPLIIAYTNEDDLILDPFMGSGTTAIGSLSLNRQYIGIDIKEEFVRAANQRIQVYLRDGIIK